MPPTATATQAPTATLRLPGQPTAAPTATAAACQERDVNRNGIIDVGDLRALVANYGARLGSLEYRLSDDANGDGVIDVEDLRVLFFLYGFPPCF